MHILFVKLSSMGDVLQALAAVHDAFESIADLEIDWVVDESFQDIPTFHPKIHNLILTNHRKWRKRPIKYRKEIWQFFKKLRSKRYDLVLDGQTNWKSALITFFSKGHSVGLDKHSVREYIAHFAYKTRLPVCRKQHALEHLREFFAKALNYKKPSFSPSFGLKVPSLNAQTKSLLPANYYVCIHAASWESKLWPEESFAKLIDLMDLPVLLFWGSEKEKQRASRIKNLSKNSILLPYLSIKSIAAILKKAKGAVSVDTGLGHLCAALGVATVGIHGPTDPNRVGSVGLKKKYLHTSLPCFPCHKSRCYHQGSYQKKPVCLKKIQPETVWTLLKNLINAP